MKSEHREFANRVFARATALLEDSAAGTLAGQSPRLTARRCRQLALRLHTVAAKLTMLADAALSIPDAARSQRARPHRRRK
jgi:hypothetical protein